MEGTIQKSDKKGRFERRAELLFAFHTLQPRSGDPLPVNSQVTAFYNASGKKNADEEGQVIETSYGLKKMAILGAAGAAIGAVFGRGKGAAAGAAAGVGSAIMINSFAGSGPNITFDKGSRFELSVSPRSIEQ